MKYCTNEKAKYCRLIQLKMAIHILQGRGVNSESKLFGFLRANVEAIRGVLHAVENRLNHGKINN